MMIVFLCCEMYRCRFNWIDYWDSALIIKCLCIYISNRFLWIGFVVIIFEWMKVVEIMLGLSYIQMNMVLMMFNYLFFVMRAAYSIQKWNFFSFNCKWNLSLKVISVIVMNFVAAIFRIIRWLFRESLPSLQGDKKLISWKRRTIPVSIHDYCKKKPQIHCSCPTKCDGCNILFLLSKLLFT